VLHRGARWCKSMTTAGTGQPSTSPRLFASRPDPPASCVS
jgi:hypothetical protein